MVKRLVIGFIVLLALAGCRTKPPRWPVVSSVCVVAPHDTPSETAYVRRMAAQFLAESGYALSDQSCDVSVKYEKFGDFQAERLHGLSAGRSGYWSEEGILSVTYREEVLLQDESITLRGYSTKQDLLYDLAWQIVAPVVKGFQPPPPQGKP